jgi:hypothetical protein
MRRETAMPSTETGSLEQEKPIPEIRPSLLLSVVLCIAGGLSLLACVGITVRTWAAGSFSWFEVLVSFGLSLIVVAVLVMPVRRQSYVPWWGWGTAVLASFYSAYTWWNVFTAQPVAHTDLLLTALWGAAALVEGLRRFRLRSGEALAASQPDSELL